MDRRNKKEEKDKKNSPSESLTRMVETVDKLWHKLENDYPDVLPNVGDVKEFSRNIKTTLSGNNKNKISEIANKIRSDLLKETKKRNIDWKTLTPYSNT
jgi:hypothetical protein